jgi:RNA-binding protein
MSLTGKQSRFLRAEAHALNPVVVVGKEGLSETVLGAVKDALLAHELIKVRLLDNAPLPREDFAEQLPPLVKAELAGLIGRVVVLYKRHPHKPKLELPRDPS